jgi:hypothetical protein
MQGMSHFTRVIKVGAALLATNTCFGAGAGAQSLALRNGDTFELGDFFHVSTDCKSLVVGTPEIEILEGPPGVDVAIRDAMVTPHALNCANPVHGSKVTIFAKNVDTYSHTTLVLRIKYKTRSGDRQSSRRYKVTLIP